MNITNLSVKELEDKDINYIIQYFLDADSAFLYGMGADVNRLPDRNEWTKMLTEQLVAPIEEKKSYYIIWEINKKAAGHSNVNKLIFGEEAYMHLHFWNIEDRKKGLEQSC
ncbi:MAG: hypothetical protein WKF59_03275 [Chitinophagaceae bacterium]